MSSVRINRTLVSKFLLAGLLLSLLAGVAGAHLAPRLPLYLAVVYGMSGAAVLALLLVGAAVLVLSLGQFILRHGGTDLQWFWFSAEPPGLVQQREQAAQAAVRARS